MATDINADNYERRRKYEILRSQLESERSSFIGHWTDLGTYVLPRRPRFMVSDRNRGDRRNQKIIDSTATLAARTLRSGMMSGVTSPARPWFRLTTNNPKMSEVGDVKLWLNEVTEAMRTVFLRSNVYNTLPIVYGDLGVFGTSAMLIEEDFTGDIIRTYAFPVGSYMLGNDDKLQVRVFMRDFTMTVRQIVEKFGRQPDGKIDWTNISTTVKMAWEEHKTEAWVSVTHVITANEDYQIGSPVAKKKRYRSCYYERGIVDASEQYTGSVEGKFLSESGYDYFPVLAPRWEVVGEDVYGVDCPGMASLGDVKQLQLGEKRIMQAIEKMVNPPMVGPTSLKKSTPSILPSDITYVDERDGVKGFRPAHEVNPRIAELEQKQEQVRFRIRRAFFEDLFLMLASTDRRQITAREVQERHEEKLLALGPVLEQLNQDLLDPMVDITFDIMVSKGLIPEPPDVIQGDNLKVEYISVMAQAQKLSDAAGLERFEMMVGDLVKVTGDPTVIDKVDIDQFVDVYSDRLGVPPDVVRSDEDVAQMRASRAEVQKQQAALENAREVTGAVKDLSEVDMSKDSALTRAIEQSQAGRLG